MARDIRSGSDFRKPLSSTQSLVVSVLLHGLLVMPPVVLSLSMPKPASQTLAVELYGMVADQQSEERTPGRTTPPPPPAPVSRPPSPKTPSPEKLARAQDSPVLVEEKPEKELPKEAPKPDTPSPSVVPIGNADELRKQAMLNVQDKSLDVLKQYLGRIKKKLQANLIYPDEAKKAGYEGATVLRFTITEAGAIKSGTLGVLRSSGHTNLDENAMNSARESVPFERPSREIEVAVAVGFAIKN